MIRMIGGTHRLAKIAATSRPICWAEGAAGWATSCVAPAFVAPSSSRPDPAPGIGCRISSVTLAATAATVANDKLREAT